MEILIKTIKTSPWSIPYHATIGSAGIDLSASIEHNICIMPQQRCLVPTGLKIAIPKRIEGQIRPRSGLAVKHGITILNAPGTIDSDYRGEIKILLINLGDKKYLIKNHMRIAQVIFSSYHIVTFKYVNTLTTTLRNESGFGSTGI